jgi:ATP-binding cassette subfamily C protein
VYFRYPATDTNILRQIDLALPARQTIALVGPSGAGKSTLADIILGLLAPSEGQILLDNRPLDTAATRHWRQAVAYVPQDTFLFHDTVRANLLWAAPAATEADLWGSLQLAAAAEFVTALPEGLDTVLGDRGIRLSGGERQRLALARALLRKPALLLLDEATSALDSEHEQRIQTAIHQLHGELTIVLIAHRLSTVRYADQIVVMEQGQIVERGDWETLSANQAGRFYELLRAAGEVEF